MLTELKNKIQITKNVKDIIINDSRPHSKIAILYVYTEQSVIPLKDCIKIKSITDVFCSKSNYSNKISIISFKNQEPPTNFGIMIAIIFN